MKIYVADIAPLFEPAVFGEKLSFVPPERQGRINQYKHQADRCRSLGAGLLLEYGLSCCGYSLLQKCQGKKMVSMRHGIYGKPYLPEETGISFNLSHAGTYAAAVFGKTEVGIDIERKRKLREAVARRFFHPTEHAWLLEADPALREMRFTEIWSRKESYSKARGEGLRLHFADFCVTNDIMVSDGTWYLRTFRQAEGYALSVCARESIDIQLEFVNLLEIGQKVW